MSRPNVIVFLTDDQGYGDLGIYGNPDLRTPHINRLAQEGVRLTQHYAGSPLCAPSRAAFLTGRYNHRTGALSVESNRGLDRIALREITLADVFKRAGYATGMIGKWHNGLHDLRYHPNQRGFDEFCGFLNGGMDYWNWLIEYNGTPERSDGRYLTDVFTHEAIEFIKRHSSEPFFLYIAYNAPHSPLEAPDEIIQPYRDLGKINEAVSTLYAMIQRMDEGVGHILDALEQEGIADSTIILFSSDNGAWLGQDRISGERMSVARYNGPFRGMKQDVLEGGIRVPAIIRWRDGLPSGRETHAMIHATDWLPTLATTCEIESVHALPLDGLNQLPVLKGEKDKLPTVRFWQFNRYEPVGNCNAAMRDGQWKLYWPRIPEAMMKLPEDSAEYRLNFDRPHTLMDVVNPPVERTLSTPDQPELYNIDDDPYERHNLADEHPERLYHMVNTLANWFESVEKERRLLSIQ